MALRATSQPVYEVAALWRDRCLRDRGSLLTDQRLWGGPVFKELRSAIRTEARDPDLSFLERLRVQLQEAPPEAIRLAAEMLLVMHLLPTNVGAKRKREEILAVWSWSGETVSLPGVVSAALENPIANPGQAYLRYRWVELAFFGVAVDALRDHANELPVVLRDPWLFAERLNRLPESQNRYLRNILPHLLFPDFFEPIASTNQKREIVQAFAGYLSDYPPENTRLSDLLALDVRLLHIRRALERESPGERVDFYEEPWNAQWRPVGFVLALPSGPTSITGSAQRAIGFAIAIHRARSRLVGRGADALILLAGVALARSEEGQDTGRFLYDVLGSAAPANRREADLLQQLDLDRRYGLNTLPTAPAPVEKLGTAAGPEFLMLLAAAEEIAEKVALPDAATVRVSSRHILAAVLVSSSGDRLLEALGYVPTILRRELHDFLLSRPVKERPDTWGEILVGGTSADTPAPRREPPTIASLASDAIGAKITDADDKLDVAGEAEAFAKVLASTTVKPPLSLGLFGDWGSGKSFFMRLLEGKIAGLAEKAARAKERGQPTTYCESVVQIWFNAWHYMDANLWASLVTHIFEELAKVLSPGNPDETDEQVRARLFGELSANQELLAQAEKRKEAAEAEREAVEGHIDDLARKRADVEGEIVARRRKLAGGLAEAVLVDELVQGQLAETAGRAGIPAGELTYERLRGRVGELRSLGARLQAIPSAIAGADRPGLRFLLTAAFLAAPVFVAVCLWWVATYTNFAITLGAAVGGAIGLWRTYAPGLRRVGEVFRRLETAQQTVEERAKQERERLAVEEAAQQGELARIRAAEVSAEEERRQVQQEIRRLTAEMEEIRAGRRLQRFLQDRIGSADYRQHLGIIALIRRDFDRLKGLIEAVAAERTAPPAEASDGSPAPPRHVDRIILYIDDLDRCPEDRVVEVLQAVHLLLAFDLFIVVVGVDSRWLLRSIEGQYARVLAPGAAVGSGSDGDGWRPTPQNYLEKIFQIPYSLRPMESGGFGGLIRGLVPIRPEEAEENEAEGRRAAPTDPAPDTRPPPGHRTGEPTAGVEIVIEGDEDVGDDGAEDDEGVTMDGSTPAAGGIDSEEPDAHLTPAELHVEAWERDFLEAMHPLIRSPRAAKRFINVYRFLRAGLSGEALERFRGTRTEGGEHRAAALLLALQTGYPAQAVDLFRDLAREDPGRTSWPGFMSMRAEGHRMAAEAGPRAGGEAREWRELEHALEALSDTLAGMPLPADLALYQGWAPRVARYSFRSGRMGRRAKEKAIGGEVKPGS